jgi:hypothetical protein
LVSTHAEQKLFHRFDDRGVHQQMPKAYMVESIPIEVQLMPALDIDQEAAFLTIVNVQTWRRK